jgi:hypothetical protein
VNGLKVLRQFELARLANLCSAWRLIALFDIAFITKAPTISNSVHTRRQTNGQVYARSQQYIPALV